MENIIKQIKNLSKDLKISIMEVCRTNTMSIYRNGIDKLLPVRSKENKLCICGEILKGEKKPFDCKLFRKVCSPSNPIGACMVSSEGTCTAYCKYRQ